MKDFLAVLHLCQELNEINSSIGNHRHSYFLPSSGGVIFKATHCRWDRGSRHVWAKAIEIDERSNIEREIRDIHAILSDRVRHDRVIVEENWYIVDES